MERRCCSNVTEVSPAELLIPADAEGKDRVLKGINAKAKLCEVIHRLAKAAGSDLSSPRIPYLECTCDILLLVPLLVLHFVFFYAVPHE